MSKNYDGLDPDERFRLAMKAAARGDEREQARLSGTCPRETYSMLDMEYLNRLKAADRLTCAYVMGLEYLHGKLDGLGLLEDVLGTLTGLAEVLFEAAYRRGYQNAGGEDPPDENLMELDLEVDALMCSARRLVALTKRVIACRVRMETEVFESACREKMGVEPEVVLDAMETCEVLSWLDLESLEGAGSDVPELALEELDLESFVADTDAALQEEGETLTSSYAAAWERAIEGEL